MSITKLDEMFKYLKTKDKKKMVAAFANDSHTIGAVSKAIDIGAIEGILVGARSEIEKVCIEKGIDVNKFTLVEEPNDVKASEKAVDIVNNGDADFIMKGLVSTDKFIRAILRKEKGLMLPKAVLSHVTVLEVPAYDKLITISDVAIIPEPDLKQKIAMTNYVIQIARTFEIPTPKVAIIAASELVSPGMQACIDGAIISKMNDRNQIKNAIVDGPLAFDVAVSSESAEIKKLKSPVAGDVDCLVFPNIESGNVFFKTCTNFAGGEMAALVMGAKCPAVLTSRGDSTKSKMYSIALACLICN